MYTLRIFMETTHIIVDHHHGHHHHPNHRHHGHHHPGKCTNLTACDYSTTNQGGLNHKMTVMSFWSITPSSSSLFLSSYRWSPWAYSESRNDHGLHHRDLLQSKRRNDPSLAKCPFSAWQMKKVGTCKCTRASPGQPKLNMRTYFIVYKTIATNENAQKKEETIKSNDVNISTWRMKKMHVCNHSSAPSRVSRTQLIIKKGQNRKSKEKTENDGTQGSNIQRWISSLRGKLKHRLADYWQTSHWTDYLLFTAAAIPPTRQTFCAISLSWALAKISS